MLNHLYLLLKLWPKFKKHSWELSDNPNITGEIVKELTDIEWNYDILGKRLPWEFIKDNPQLQWKWNYLSLNNNITYEIIQDNIKHISDSIYLLTNNNIKVEHINKHLQEVCGKNVPFYVDNIWDAIEYALNYDYILLMYMSYRTELTWEIIDKYKHYPWDMYAISGHKIITLNDVLKRPDLKWQWNVLSQNLKISMGDILQNKNLPWEWMYISLREDIDINIVLNNIDEKWIWAWLSSNIAITWTDIITHPTLSWDWGCISLNPNITPEIITNNPNCSWDWGYISSNPSITYKFIINNKDKEWCHRALSENVYNKNKYVRRRLIVKKYISIWRRNIKRRKEYFAELYAPVLDMYKLRLRDIENGVRHKLN